MAGNGIANLTQKLFPGGGQSAPGGDDIVGVISPVNGLEACQVFQKILFLFEDLQGGCLYQYAVGLRPGSIHGSFVKQFLSPKFVRLDG